MRIKIGIVGKSQEMVETDVPEGSTVIDACREANNKYPGTDWLSLAQTNKVRVNYKTFSNNQEGKIESDCHGNIFITPLESSVAEYVILLIFP